MEANLQPLLPTLPLRDFCIRITKGTTPTTLGRSFVDRGINFVKSEAITHEGRIDPSSFAAIDAETHAALARSILEERDVLFSMAGVYLGKTAVVPKSVLPANTNQAVGIIRLDRSKADARFVHYSLSSPFVRDYVRRSVAQSAQPNYNLADIGSLPIPDLPLPKQRAIARILGSLDDKIELNRKTNATLEAMARALFKSWFIDFNPVRAKAGGRAPSGMDAETARLFPSELVESDRGPVPKGWDPSTLERYADLNSETWARMTYPASIQYVDLSGTKWGVIESLSLFSREDAPSRAQRVLRRGDTIVGTVRPGNGSFAIVDRDGLTGSTGFAVLRPRRPEARTFIYFAATSRENIDRLAHLADGGAYPAVRPELVVQTEAAGAPDNVVTRFEAAVASIMDRIASSRAESAALARVRDELLPRLLSGAIDIGALADARGEP